jgi:hypothetical protein
MCACPNAATCDTPDQPYQATPTLTTTSER